MQTLVSVTKLRLVKAFELEDFTSLGTPTPLSTRSPLRSSSFCRGEIVPTD